MRQNLTAEPRICRIAPGRSAMKVSVRASRCDRLTATIQGAPGPGWARMWIVRAEALWRALRAEDGAGRAADLQLRHFERR